jgi:hypothetical protein
LFTIENDSEDNINYLLDETNRFMVNYMSHELLSNLFGTGINEENISSFNFSNCPLSNVFKYILTKDKGIGGFEQINSKRSSNIVKHYKTMINSSRRISLSKFVDSLMATYFHDNCEYINPLYRKENPRFNDYFMKGRKEGPNNSNKNHYNPETSTSISTKYTNDEINLFGNVGKIILALYDIITFEMICDVKIPVCFDDKTEITSHKVDIIREYIENNDCDVMFVTEYLDYNSFEDFDSDSDSDLDYDFNNEYNFNNVYKVYIGKEKDGLTNAIIIRKTLGDFSVIQYPENINNEFKEPPLVIGNSDVTLICYHAGGKGILQNVNNFTETQLFKYISDFDNKVICGGDFNTNIYSNTCIFGVEDNPNIKISSYKMRTSLQAQFDKTYKKDKSKKDDFVVKDCSVLGESVIMVGEENYQKVTKDIDESYIIPNNSHPFDHYFVNYKFQIFNELEKSFSDSDSRSQSQSKENSEDDLEETFRKNTCFTRFRNFVKYFMKKS